MANSDLFHGECLKGQAELYLGEIPDGDDEAVRLALYEFFKDKDTGSALEFKFGKPMTHFSDDEKKETITTYIESDIEDEETPITNRRVLTWCLELKIDPETGQSIE